MSDSVRPHRRQPTRLPHPLQPTRLLCPGDFPGKSTGVGCHRDQTCVTCIERWIFFGGGGFFFFLFFYWRIIVYRILLFSVKPQERWILNHWTTREVSALFFKSTFIVDQLQHVHSCFPLSASMPLAMWLCSPSHLEGLASGVAPTNRMQKWWCVSSQRPQETLHVSAIFLDPWLCHTKSLASIMGDDGLCGGKGKASSWQPASPNQLANLQLTTHTWRNPADFSPAEPRPNYQS